MAVCDAWPVRRQTHSNLRNPIITWARKDERLSRPSWLTYSGQFANEVVNCPVVSRAHDRESSRVITGIWQSYIIWYRQLRYRGILEIDKRRLSTQRMLPDTPMTAKCEAGSAAPGMTSSPGTPAPSDDPASWHAVQHMAIAIRPTRHRALFKLIASAYALNTDITTSSGHAVAVI